MKHKFCIVCFLIILLLSGCVSQDVGLKNDKILTDAVDGEINMAFSAHYQSGVEEPDKESCVWKR